MQLRPRNPEASAAVRGLIALLETPLPKEQRAWAAMTTTERQMLLRAANCSERASAYRWEQMPGNTRVAVRRAAEMLGKHMRRLCDA